MKSNYKTKAKEAEANAKDFDKKRRSFLRDNTTRDPNSYTDEIFQKENKYEEDMANAYWAAAKNWIAAKKPQRAIKDFHLAGRAYGDLYQSRFTNRKDVEKFRARCYKAISYQERLEKVKKGKWHGLEGKVAVALVLIIGSIFFLSPNITGNVIGNLSNNNSNFLGAILFILGIGFLLFIFRRNK